MSRSFQNVAREAITPAEEILCAFVQYYERTAELVGEIRDILDTDVMSADNLEKLENFKRDANAYGKEHRPRLIGSWAFICLSS
jgi:hypothetical protein